MRLHEALYNEGLSLVEDITVAHRSYKGYSILIWILHDKAYFLRRVSAETRPPKYIRNYEEDFKIYPHLGALLNDALKNKYTEVRAYANDWSQHWYYASQLLSTFFEKEKREEEKREAERKEMEAVDRLLEEEEEERLEQESRLLSYNLSSDEDSDIYDPKPTKFFWHDNYEDIDYEP